MVLFAIPLILGLIWNKWAGGAAGFIMGTLLLLGEAGYNNAYNAINYQITTNLYSDPSFIGNYIVGGILIGYIAGCLSKGSMNFKRMLGAGLTAAISCRSLTVCLQHHCCWRCIHVGTESTIRTVPSIVANGNSRHNRTNRRKSNDLVWASASKAL